MHVPTENVPSEEKEEAMDGNEDREGEYYERPPEIYGKCCMDDAATLDEAVEKLEELIADLRILKAEGYELIETVLDGRGELELTGKKVP